MSGRYGDHNCFDEISVEDVFPEPEGIAEAAAYFAELNRQHFDEVPELEMSECYWYDYETPSPAFGSEDPF